MTLSADMAAAAAVLEGWTATEVRPSNPGGWTPPAKTGSQDAAAAWLAYGLHYTEAELADFDGGQLREGLLEVVIFVEPGVGTALARTLLDALSAAVVAGSSAAFELLAPKPSPAETVDLSGEAWEAWPLVTRFIAQN